VCGEEIIIISGLALFSLAPKDLRLVMVFLTNSRSSGLPTSGRKIGAWGYKQAKVIILFY